LDIWTSCITIWHEIMVKVMFTSLPVPFFHEFIFKTNLMRNQEKPFRIWNKLSLVRAQAQLHKKMLTLNVTNCIIMKITVWPYQQDNVLTIVYWKNSTIYQLLWFSFIVQFCRYLWNTWQLSNFLTYTAANPIGCIFPVTIIFFFDRYKLNKHIYRKNYTGKCVFLH
jgi:hypothetical protein